MVRRVYIALVEFLEDEAHGCGAADTQAALDAVVVHMADLLGEGVDVGEVEDASRAKRRDAVLLGEIGLGADPNGQGVVVVAPQDDGVVLVVSQFPAVLADDLARAVDILGRNDYIRPFFLHISLMIASTSKQLSKSDVDRGEANGFTSS